jgi:hypothetical protein
MKKAKALNKKLDCLEIILFNAIASVIHKSKLKAANAKIQITRLLVKLDCLEIILFNTLAFFMHKSKSQLGLMYEKGKGVKQDDFKALKFYQKACDLNFNGGCSQLEHPCLFHA